MCYGRRWMEGRLDEIKFFNLGFFIIFIIIIIIFYCCSDTTTISIITSNTTPLHHSSTPSPPPSRRDGDVDAGVTPPDGEARRGVAEDMGVKVFEGGFRVFSGPPHPLRHLPLYLVVQCLVG